MSFHGKRRNICLGYHLCLHLKTRITRLMNQKRSFLAGVLPRPLLISGQRLFWMEEREVSLQEPLRLDCVYWNNFEPRCLWIGGNMKPLSYSLVRIVRSFINLFAHFKISDSVRLVISDPRIRSTSNLRAGTEINETPMHGFLFSLSVQLTGIPVSLGPEMKWLLEGRVWKAFWNLVISRRYERLSEELIVTVEAPTDSLPRGIDIQWKLHTKAFDNDVCNIE